MSHECAKCGTPIHVAPELEFDDDDLCWSCLDEEVREARICIAALEAENAALKQKHDACEKQCAQLIADNKQDMQDDDDVARLRVLLEETDAALTLLASAMRQRNMPGIAGTALHQAKKIRAALNLPASGS